MKNNTEQAVKNYTLVTLTVISVLYFLAFLFPNGQGAQDLNMLSVFEPDEFGQYSHALRMIDQPADTFMQSVYRFVQYKHYYYGYPFYLYSVLFALLPARLFAGIASVSLDFLLLRQLVSVLPMLAAVWLLVYMQTKFQRFWVSIFLFLFLLFIPMVVENNLWWHPESLSVFFVVLTIYFLQKDKLSFGRDFFLAAIACGLAAAVKLVGVFFVITIPSLILYAWWQGKLPMRNAVQTAVKFVFFMLITFFIFNPFLVFTSERDEAFRIQVNQSEASASGFVLAADKGPLSWLPILERNYADASFLLLAGLALLAGITDREKRLLYVIILLWCMAFGGYLLFFVALKHKYYFLPIIVPLFSALPALFNWKTYLPAQFFENNYVKRGMLLLLIIVFSLQSVWALDVSLKHYVSAVGKEANNESIRFFAEIEKDYLAKLELDRPLLILRHVHMYVPNDPRWDVRHRWGLTTYSYIERTAPDAILLWKQELYDFTNETVLNSAVNPERFAEALPFYQDALNQNLVGYIHVYEDAYGILYIRDDLARQYLDKE
jgi:hypothetical protein